MSRFEGHSLKAQDVIYIFITVTYIKNVFSSILIVNVCICQHHYCIWSILSIEKTICIQIKYRGADKSLARPGRKQAAPVKSVMGRGMDCFG